MSKLGKLLFFFDPISPYTYFALQGLEKVAAKHSMQIQVMPVLFAGTEYDYGVLKYMTCMRLK
ncbi:hypothetical protein EON63_24850 [archaeon]|nr:MAG: hypothetical protein EON63_24850 [archaeon]